jgi:hypothetical protein
VKPFHSGRIASELMAKHTSLLTKNTAFFSINSKLRRENSKSDKMAAKYHSPQQKKTTLFGQKQLDLEGNIEQTA